jgi:hypothetical protein
VVFDTIWIDEGLSGSFGQGGGDGEVVGSVDIGGRPRDAFAGGGEFGLEGKVSEASREARLLILVKEHRRD